MKRCMLVGLIAGMVPFLYGEVIYENDFSTRTSAGAIPTTNWYEMSYHVGQLALNYDKKWTGDSVPYQDQGKIQDGWALANINSANNNYVMAAAYVATNSVEQVPEGDDTNQFFKVHGATYARTAMATHPIGNEFSNGVVRVSADLRAPAVWPAGEDSVSARVVPLYKSQMNALNWGGSYQTPAAFAMLWRNASQATVPFLLSGQGLETSESAVGTDMSPTHVGRYWHRFVMDINLDTKRVSCSVYKLGLGNPTPETQGTLVASTSNKQFYRPLTAERKAISGIGLYTYRTIAEANAVTNSACFDNLSIAWKAPGASDFQVCYENDFTTRRYRTLCPTGTTSAAYPPATTSSIVSDDYWGYYAGQTIVPASDVSLKNKQPQPQGADNWRRINDDGGGTAQLIQPTSSGLAAFGRILRVTGAMTFVCVTQPLGEEISTGKVRLSVDVRLPDKWHWNGSRNAAATLGTTAYASALYNDVSNGRVGPVGIRASTTAADECKFYPFYNNGSTQTQTDINCVSQNWYRIIQTADMDANPHTYNFELYHLTTNGVVDGTVFAVTNATFAREVPAIGSFALLAYAAGDTTAQSILFDNIKVWKNYGASDELQIYFNNFTYRRRKFEDARRNIATKIDRPGLDHWTRRNNGLAAAFVRPLANPALSIVGAADHAYLFHTLGTTVGHGKTLSFSIDIRPPNKWRHDTRYVYVMVGDDIFHQGNRSSADPFGNHYSTRFGFTSKDTEIKYWGMYMDTVSMVTTNRVVRRGSQIDPSHWYRFRMKATVDAPTYSVKLYDMGTSHPEMSTPDGTLVESFDDLAYSNGGPVNGFSSFALGGFGVPGFEPWNDDDPTTVFYDNIRAEIIPSGALIIFR